MVFMATLVGDKYNDNYKNNYCNFYYNFTSANEDVKASNN